MSKNNVIELSKEEHEKLHKKLERCRITSKLPKVWNIGLHPFDSFLDMSKETSLKMKEMSEKTIENEIRVVTPSLGAYTVKPIEDIPEEEIPKCN